MHEVPLILNQIQIANLPNLLSLAYIKISLNSILPSYSCTQFADDLISLFVFSTFLKDLIKYETYYATHRSFLSFINLTNLW